jgi:ParB family chromosome partitioning protein
MERDAASPSIEPQPIPAETTVSATALSSDGQQISELPLQQIIDSPDQPRKRYDETALKLLGDMLLDRGQDEAIIVRRLPDGRFELIAGHRRVRAARLIGWGTIKARVVDYDNRSAKIATLVSNEGREDQSDYERGVSYMIALRDKLANTQAEIARMFGCSQPRVQQCLSLARLPQEITSLLDEYPGLIGYRFAATIKELHEQFPTGIDTIRKAVEQVIDKPDTTPEDVRRLVVAELGAKQSRTVPVKAQIVQDSAGASVYSVKVKQNQVVIDVSEGADVGLTGKRVLAALREIVQSAEKEKNPSKSKG